MPSTSETITPVIQSETPGGPQMRQSSVSAATDRSVNVEAKDTHEEKPTETMSSTTRRKQRWNSWGQKWRSSAWYITAVVALGVATDALAYAVVVPVLPYRLQDLGYTNISGLTSWLMFAYSIGIFIMTFPVAWYFARHPYRRGPLVISVCVLEAGLLLFMLCKPYWVMVVARFLQGAASTVVWTVGFALICENVEEKNLGRQIGYAVAGVSIGTTIAPPIGGALYWNLGWHSPFIFTIIICAIDLFMRLLVIEQKDLPRPVNPANPIASADVEKFSDPDEPASTADESPTISSEDQITKQKQLSPWGILVAFAKSPRGMNGFAATAVYGLIVGAVDPTLTLRVQSVWHKNSSFVGLAYLAASAPSFVAAPIVGALADKYGSEWIMFPSFVFTAPWIALLLLKSSLPAFVVYFALGLTGLNCALGPVGLEVAMAARQIEGMSEIHQFAAMNLAFAISTSVGAVVGGQLYDHVSWAAVCWFSFGAVVVSLPLPFCLAGNKPLYKRIIGRSDEEVVDNAPS